jgi:hypothetical protein
MQKNLNEWGVDVRICEKRDFNGLTGSSSGKILKSFSALTFRNLRHYTIKRVASTKTDSYRLGIGAVVHLSFLEPLGKLTQII